MPPDHGPTTVPPASHPDDGTPVVLQQSSLDGLSMLPDGAARGGVQTGRLDVELLDVRYVARTATRTKGQVGYQ